MMREMKTFFFYRKTPSLCNLRTLVYPSNSVQQRYVLYARGTRRRVASRCRATYLPTRAARTVHAVLSGAPVQREERGVYE